MHFLENLNRNSPTYIDASSSKNVRKLLQELGATLLAETIQSNFGYGVKDMNAILHTEPQFQTVFCDDYLMFCLL
jgi:hypothetical protein